MTAVEAIHELPFTGEVIFFPLSHRERVGVRVLGS